MDVIQYLRQFRSDNSRTHFLALTEHVLEGEYAPEDGPSLIFDGGEVDSFMVPLFRHERGAGFGWGEFDLKASLISADRKRVEQRFEQFDLEDPARWVHISIRPATEKGISAQVYDDILEEDGVRHDIEDIQPVPDELQEVLQKFAWTDGIENASEDFIASVLGGATLGRERFVAAYDVGQGNCNAVLGRDVRPHIYFDFGRPLGFNKHTEPNPWPRFCFCAAPAIVLSHWDFDHWAGARLDKMQRRSGSPWLAQAVQTY